MKVKIFNFIKLNDSVCGFKGSSFRSMVERRIGVMLLLSFSILGGFVFQDYGVCWDESCQRDIGLVNYYYITDQNNDLETYFDRDYGVAFELPLILIETVLRLEDSSDIYKMRHLVSHLFFLLGAYFLFLLIDFLYQNKLLASLGFLMVVLTPLFYAHSFFNTKDIPFATMFIISLYISAIAFRKQKIFYFLLLGIALGLLINIRIMGVLLFISLLFFLLLDAIFFKSKSTPFAKTLFFMFVLIYATLGTLYVSWPYLWSHPVQNFVTAFTNMSKFRWDALVLFDGALTKPTSIGWRYIPVWFSITTPILTVVMGLVGVVLLLFRAIRNPKIFLENSPLRNNLLYLICFTAPVAAVILFKSVLYDSWRQVFFIYPPFILLGIYFIHSLMLTKFKMAMVMISFLGLAYVGFFMVVNHPFQHLYFNEFVDVKTPEKLRSQFELDYWGTAYKQSLEHVLANDSSPVIYIACANIPGVSNWSILSPTDRNRIQFVEPKNATYFITNYRWHPEDYEEYKTKKWHAIRVQNNTINEVFKLK